MKIRILNADEVRKALPMKEAIQAMKDGYAQLSAGAATVPLRTQIPIPERDALALIMPAFLHESQDLAVKIVSVFPHNPTTGKPTISAIVAVIDATDGSPIALLEGGSLTALRTGAASGAATDLLAREDAHSAAIIGTGVQARTQLEAVCTVRPISEVRVFSLDHDQAQTFCAEMTGKGPIPNQVNVAQSAAEAVAESDIICTATTSKTPVFPYRSLRDGAHINAIGAFTPEMQEIDAQIVQHARIVVDSREAVLKEAGDLIIPLREGLITLEDIHAELGEIVLGLKPGRVAPEQITLFKSVGVAVQDAIAAGRALERATAEDIGEMIDM